MRRTKLIACTLGLAAAASAFAAAPRLQVTETVTIDAPVPTVWKAVKDFNGLNTWHPAVAKDEIIEGQNNHVDAVRLLTLKDGGTIKEKLLVFNPAAHTIKYTILEGVIPVSDYTSTIRVTGAGTGKSLVTWSGHFMRKNTGDNPGPNENDKTATDTIHGIYRSGLDNLKKQVEGSH
jgi:mxaD protein